MADHKNGGLMDRISSLREDHGEHFLTFSFSHFCEDKATTTTTTQPSVNHEAAPHHTLMLPPWPSYFSEQWEMNVDWLSPVSGIFYFRYSILNEPVCDCSRKSIWALTGGKTAQWVSSNPISHIGEGKIWLQKIVIWPLYTTGHELVHARTNTK